MKQKFNDAYDFESYCDDVLTDFIDTFTFDNGLIRNVDEDDDVDDNVLSFVFTQKGTKLIDRFKNRLQKIGDKLFPNEEIEVKCSSVIEF